MVTIDTYVDEVLDRLGDLEAVVWNRPEVEAYVQDGEDQFTRRTECLFDIFVIENTPQFRNWQTHLERYYASQRPGWTVSDEPFQQAGVNPLGTGGRVGGSHTLGNFTKSSEAPLIGADGSPAEEVSRAVHGGPVPDNTVKLLRVTYDNRMLKGVSSQTMRRLDVNYETRTGEPRWFVYDKDGLFYVRVVPAATGDASYPTVIGSFGTLTQNLVEVVGPPEGLIGYWPLEESAQPWVDTVCGALIIDAAATPSQILGKNGYGIDLGHNETLEAITTSSEYSRADAHATSFWFNPPSSVQSFVGGGADVFKHWEGSRIEWHGASSRLIYSGVTSGTAAVATGAFYHIVASYDGVDTERIYVNGVLDAEITGVQTGSSRFAFSVGYVDEIAHYDRELSQTDVDALYSAGQGSFYIAGALVSTSEEVIAGDTGGRGVLRGYEDGTVFFPSGGPWGSPTRLHPHESNIQVELVRTGRPLATHPSELPDAYTKYIIYFAMAKALKRMGPGHDEKLGDHYASRFEMGVAQMKNKKNHFNSERVGRFGGQAVEESFGIGIPQPPSDWGFVRR